MSSQITFIQLYLISTKLLFPKNAAHWLPAMQYFILGDIQVGPAVHKTFLIIEDSS